MLYLLLYCRNNSKNITIIPWVSASIVLLWCFVFPATRLRAQALDCSLLSPTAYSICDNFADANLDNPTWIGDVAQFIVNASGQLQSNSTGTDTVAISTALDNGMPEEWRIKAKMDFDPSANNRLRIYLVADQADLKSNSLNAYYLSLGENGAADAIELYRQNGGIETLVVRGIDATVAISPDLYLKVNRSAAGEWSIYTAPGSGGTYTLDASATDTGLNIVSGYLGVWCKHTATNATKFYFDDVFASLPPPDNIAPQALSISVLDYENIDVLFSEPVGITAQNTANYILSGPSIVTTATIDGTNPALVHLSLSSPLLLTTHNLTISNITDLAGNVMLPATFDVFYYAAQAGDVIINEIFADPDPSVGLPAYEFVELYNRTNIPVSLAGWHFGDNPTAPQCTLPDITLLPYSYLILCANNTDAVAAYSTLGTTVGLTAFPALNNTGDALVLTNADWSNIDAVTYSDSWFDSADKRAGGWTLELINADIACATESNWRESEAILGGTPGAVNSVTGLYNDTTAPQILSVQVIDEQTLLVLTSETVNPATAELLSNYALTGGINIADATVQNSGGIVGVQLLLSSPLQIGTLYTLSVNNIADCSDNVAAAYSSSFALPQIADTYDVLISEIYADYDAPDEFVQPNLDLPAAKYIELYNRSTKTISLQNWYLTDLADTTQLDGYLLLADSRVVLCSTTKTSLFTERGIPALGVTSFTDPNTTGDLISVYNADGQFIHSVNYDKTWYRDPIKQEGGWSLEMIDANNPCEGFANWTASENEKGGTPATSNSVARSNADVLVPDLLRAEVVNPTTVLLYFSEILDRATAENIAHYTINNGIGQPIGAQLLTPANKQVLLTLGTPLQVNIVYELTANLVSDCAGNAIGIYHTAKVGITQTPESGDVIINEVLFNPVLGGYDYIELYNRSDHIVSLSGWYFAQVNVTENPDSITAYLPLLTERYTLFPDQYAVLTENIESVIAQYSLCGETVPATAFVRADLPSMNDDEGIVSIVSLFAADTLDVLHYYDTWHNPLLDTPDGFALERVDYSQPTQNPNNWQSGASAVCGGTPGYQNSQFYAVSGTTELNSMAIDPPAISPDGDGLNDFATISYAFDQSGYTIDLLIYDERGRELRHLVRNDIAATEGYYKWDGTLEDGSKAKVGIYVLRMQAFNAIGSVLTFKKTVAVVGKND